MRLLGYRQAIRLLLTISLHFRFLYHSASAAEEIREEILAIVRGNAVPLAHELPVAEANENQEEACDPESEGRENGQDGECSEGYPILEKPGTVQRIGPSQTWAAQSE